MILSSPKNFSIWITDKIVQFTFYAERLEDEVVPGKCRFHIDVLKWNHIAITRTGSHTIIFNNGVEVIKEQTHVKQSSREIFFGAKDKLPSFIGLIKDLRLWADPLTQEEIRVSMNSEYLEYTAKLLAWFPFVSQDKNSKVI